MKNTHTKKASDKKIEKFLENIDKKVINNTEDIKGINNEATSILVQLRMMLQYIDSLSDEAKDKFDYDDIEKN